jgi:polyferredoxin
MLRARRLLQIVFLLFFIFLFIKARFPYELEPASDLFLRFSPLIPLFDFIDNLRIYWSYWPAILIILLTPFIGRFFCGWICPLGTTLDLSGKLLGSPSNKISNKFQNLRYLKFTILLALMVLAVFSINLWGHFDPLSIFNRALTVLLYPLSTIALEESLLLLTNISWLETPVYFIYDILKEFFMPEEQAYLQQIFWIAIFFGVIIGLEKLSKRFWCRYICPAGAWLGFLSQFRLYERIVGEICPICNKCQVECKMNAIPDQDVALTNKVECIECFSCGALCPPKTKAISYRWNWKPYHTPVDFKRRQFIQTSVGSFITLGLISIGLHNRETKDRLIRPPGSLPEDEFLDRCIRCMQCVRICESNGKCLQPAGIHNSVLELWAPIAIMREGYCEYNCNLCCEVCPTEAILPLSLEQKQKTPMGFAYFEKNICIPFAQNEDCIVCQEHCPTPEKAIIFEIKDFVLPDGGSRKVKYPYIDRQLCIGCGICETKCPLPGAPGIYVTTENELRLEAQDVI